MLLEYYLQLHENLPDVLEKNNIKIIISIHHDSYEYKQKLEKIKKTSNDINSGVGEKISGDTKNFSKQNKNVTSVSSQKKVPPFSDNEINNVI